MLLTICIKYQQAGCKNLRYIVGIKVLFSISKLFFSVSCDWLDQDTTLPDEMFVPEYKSKVSATIGSWGWPLRF